MNPTAQRLGSRPARQCGYVLLLTLIALVVLLFGVLFTLRGNLLENVMTGNTAQRQKDVHVGDLALRQVQQALIALVQNSGNQVLDVAAQGQPWFFTPPSGAMPASAPFYASPPGTANAYPDFWSNCQSNEQCAPLSSVVSVLSPAPPVITAPGGQPYQVLVSVWPTNRPTDAYACGTTGYTASYYAIYLHIAEPNGTTVANTQSVIKLCTL